MSAPIHAATDPGVSAWVSANAGAGKTYLLTDRVTRLLLSGASPSRILCLTYTKAAAAEMATRLFNRLGEWALLPDDKLAAHLLTIGADPPDAPALRKARTLFAQALETPGGLKIQTIHSFCQHILARFPVEAGIPARFTVLDERSTGELMAQARNAVLERAAAGDPVLANAVALLATRAADGRFAEILNFAVGDSGKLRELLARHDGEAARYFAHLRNTMGIAHDEDEAQILTRFCADVFLDRAQLLSIAPWLLGGSSRDRELAARFSAFLDTGSDPAGYEQLSRAFRTGAGTARKRLVTKKLADERPDLFTFIESLCDRFLRVEDRRKCAVTVALTEALVTVGLAVLTRFDALKHERAALDYDDLILSTLSLLDRRDAASWVLYKLDGGLDHILVDEAQDTSPEQWQIIRKLADEFFAGAGRREDGPPRTLFAVGDEKQSIFSFQGAEPAQFGRHREIFKALAEGAKLPFADWRPPVSRRSARTVLEYVDAVFAAEDARDGLTSSNDSIHHDPHRSQQGRVEIWPLVEAPAGEDHDLWNRPVDALARNSSQMVLAQRIAARIAGWLRDGLRLPGTDTPITPGDIMILVRRRNAFAEEVIRQLLDKGVAVAGADRMVLTEQIAIADLVALGRFVLLPEDDLNLAALLKSPVADLSEDQLYDLAHNRAGRSLWEEFSAHKNECANFERAHAFLSDMLAKADYLPPFEFFAHALGKELRRRIMARLGAEAADAIDEFLGLALAHEALHPPSLESFLDWFVKGASEVKRDMDEAGGAVRVMTVHGAKGLEANVVILPDTAQVPDHERREPLLYAEDCVFYGVPKILETPAITAAKTAAQSREMQEYRRLLYVAATRAREFLVVCGYENKNKPQGVPWYRHLVEAGRKIGQEETIEGETVIALGALLSRGAAVTPVDRARIQVPDFFARMAAPEPAPRTLRPSEAVGLEEAPLVSPLRDSGKRFQRGMLVHALLARLPDITPDKREAAALAYLKRQKMSTEDAQALIAETFGILDHPIFAALFAAGSRAEVAVAAELPELGNVRISGQIDRLAVTDDAVLIADFKTNRPPPADVEQTPRLYRTQMALYRAALQKIYPAKRIECVLVWTDGARLMPLPAALLDAEIGRITAT